MLVREKKCNQCLFSKNKIVTPSRAKSLIKESLAKDTYFTCHKSQTVLDDRTSVCCRGFWDSYKHHFNLGRISQRLGIVRFVKVK